MVAPPAVPAVALPARFVDRLRQIVPPDRYDACWQAFHGPRATAYRVNRLRTTPAALQTELEAAGLHPVPVPWLADAALVPDSERRALTETAACAEGRLYLQNPSSLVPPLALAPGPTDRVLDLCAAPGGKTLHLAALTGQPGQIAAVELSRPRFFRLKRNLVTGGAAAVRTYQRDGSTVWRHCPEQFDRVLLDAPCSGEGLIDATAPETWEHWDERQIRQLSRRQTRLLYSAVQCLKPGGTLVYSTCTLAPEENEEVIHAALERWGAALRVEAVGIPVPGLLPGLTGWQGRQFDPQLSGAGRIAPDGVMEAFFICRMTKTASTPTP